MTTQNLATEFGHADLIHRIATFATPLRLVLRRRAAYNKTLNELSSCTDRDLNDLGIARYDIPRIAREAADTVC